MPIFSHLFSYKYNQHSTKQSLTILIQDVICTETFWSTRSQGHLDKRWGASKTEREVVSDEPCGTCGGSGKVTCSNCGGTGQTGCTCGGKADCGSCGGLGWVGCLKEVS